MNFGQLSILCGLWQWLLFTSYTACPRFIEYPVFRPRLPLRSGVRRRSFILQSANKNLCNVVTKYELNGLI
jgi:hypothetical protein